ncbi:hypothetical protein [Streptomyces sp. CA-111067]|uniref:hypothetical protein n=1 Tax=Streptomyces sp. CA-111067 TaxID=3240046 RepID=UPI003D987745
MSPSNVPDDPQGMDHQNSEPEAQPEPAPEVEPTLEGAAEAEPAAEAEAESAPEAVAEADEAPEADTKPEPAREPEAAPEPETAAEKSAPEPDPEPEPEARSPHSECEESFDEAAVRALMRDAVRSIEPSAAALDYLQRAVPARRQHRRQALAGAVAAVLLVGMAVPALMRVAGHESRTSASAVSTASSQAPTLGGHSGSAGGSNGSVGVPGKSPGVPDGSGSTSQAPPQAGHGGTYDPPGTSSSHTSGHNPVPADAPLCAGSQLGQGASDVQAPDSGGKVYGWFRVANVSSTPCKVPNGGQVDAVAHGAADASKIAVVDHTAGDPAAGLPSSDPDQPIVLGPGEDYEVAFAWVPADTGPGGCPVPTTPPDTPTPTDTPTADPGSADPGGAAAPGTDSSDLAPQLLMDETPDPSVPQASVALNHTAVPGAPTVDGPVIQDACAGTIYTATVPPAPTDTATPTP